MPEILEQMAAVESRHKDKGFAIAAGIVTNNLDLISEGRVMVRIPARPSFEVWARIAAAGGASGRGLAWIPAMQDEVLVAFSEDDLSSAYVLGGLWSTKNRPPLTIPTDFLTKRVLKTGLTEAVGHTIEMDDALQSITVKTSTGQSITMDPLKIEVTNLASSVKITLDNSSQKVTVQALGSIELSALTEISLKAAQISLQGQKVDITSVGPCTVTGLPIKLN